MARHWIPRAKRAVSRAHHRGRGPGLELECLSRSNYWPSTCPNWESVFVKCLPFRFKIGFSYQMSFHINRGSKKWWCKPLNQFLEITSQYVSLHSPIMLGCPTFSALFLHQGRAEIQRKKETRWIINRHNRAKSENKDRLFPLKLTVRRSSRYETQTSTNSKLH